jgi:hypothetical protein
MKVQPTIQQKIQALTFCLEAAVTMHGSVTGDDHTAEPSKCLCQYGEAIRFVRVIRKELYARVSESRKARKLVKK